MRSRLSLSVAVTLLAAAGLSTLPLPQASAATAPTWNVSVPGGWFAWGSPAIGDVNGDGSNDVVVGGQDGGVYVYDANGNRIWRGQADAAVASTPAIGDVDGDGRNEVVVGTGALDKGAYNGPKGVLDIFDSNGGLRCRNVLATPYGPNSLVTGAPAIGDVTGDGTNDIVFGSHNTTIYVTDGRCNTLATFNNRDSVFSTPALYDVDGSGQLDILIGGDATANGAVAGDSFNGGVFRRLQYNGTPTLSQVWRREAVNGEAFQSAAAVGDITGDGVAEVVTGSGAFYCQVQHKCAESNKVWAFNLKTGADVPGWPKRATMNTTYNAPALGDLDGDGIADVTIGSTNFDGGGNLTGGAVDAFYSKGGQRTYVTAPNPGQQPGSPIIADVDGAAGNEVVIGNIGPIHVLTGSLTKTNVDFSGPMPLNHLAASAVGQFGGKWMVITTGFESGNLNGRIQAFTIATPKSAPWPMFGKNSLHLGTDPVGIVPIQCNSGYRLVAADGGVFAFGDSGFFGSAGGVRLNMPIVGGTPTKSNNGYWFVASDGGIFNYGDARFYGSTGGVRLNQPIVGMAAHPSGNGYWLVASDGGIFNYGEAKFFGSTGGIRLNKPIVGMAATPSGNGYWLVASDGGIFNYGDAKFYGSTGAVRLNKPIVGMSRSDSGFGYWFVASDGGIFNYGDARFYGSTGGVTLTQPVVGMRATKSGKGYWFVASDGGIFNYGDAEFCGSTGRRRLNSPIVALS